MSFESLNNQHYPDLATFKFPNVTLQQNYANFKLIIGFVEFVPISGELMFLPMYNQTMRPYFTWAGCLASCIFGFFKCCPCLLRYLIFHLKKRGIVVLMFNVNRYKELDTVKAYGANGVLTDSPEKTSKYYNGIKMLDVATKPVLNGEDKV